MLQNSLTQVMEWIKRRLGYSTNRKDTKNDKNDKSDKSGKKVKFADQEEEFVQVNLPEDVELEAALERENLSPSDTDDEPIGLAAIPHFDETHSEYQQHQHQQQQQQQQSNRSRREKKQKEPAAPQLKPPVTTNKKPPRPSNPFVIQQPK